MPSRLTADLDRATCLGLLATRSFGRLIFTRRALPEVLPVPYQLDRERVLIRLAAGSPAAKASYDAIVAFEIDDFDPSSGTGWSVTVVGLAQELVNPDERVQLVTHGLSSWAMDGHDRLLAVGIERISGQRLSTAADSA